MNTRTTLAVLSLLVTVAVLRAWSPGEAVLPQGPDLTVFITGDQNGEVASCGCAQEDYGGLTRRAAFIDTLRASGWDIVLLDGGDLSPYLNPVPQDWMKTETVARAMALMGYDAVTLGDHDLAQGADSTARLVSWLGRPVLATNYALPGGSDRERVVTSRGRKIGLLGFLDPRLVPQGATWIQVEPWERSKKRVQALRKRVDVLIALAHVPDSTAATRLARLYPQIDLVISSHEGKLVAPLVTVGKTAVIGAAGRGRYLTRVEIPMDAKGRPGPMKSKFLPVVDVWGRRANVDSLVAAYNTRVLALLTSDTFEEERAKSLREPAVEFVGSAACVSCHAGASAQWERTLHAKAKDSLVRDGKDGDPECQTCHTTGFGFRTGFVSPKATPAMWGVGCESCHGGGAAHVAAPQAPYGAVTEATCTSCHDGDQDPDFEYSLELPQVVHADK